MNRDGLKRENEELRRQLGEAQEALAAIRGGEVDAIVVEGASGAQVFSLSGAETVYRVLVETMYEGALTVSRDGAIQFCNKRFCDLMRTPAEAALGRPIADFVAESHKGGLASLLSKVREGPVQKRLEFVAADKTVVPVQLTAIKLEVGGAESACIVISDLTDLEASAQSLATVRKHEKEMEAAQKQLRESRVAALNLMEDALAAKEELRASEERFRVLSETSPVGMGVVALPEGTFLYVNPSYEQAFGYSPGELVGGKSPDIWWDPAERERVVAALKETGTIADYEVRLKRKDGSMFWGLASNKPITYNGRPALLGTFVDISDRKKAELALAKNASRLDLLSRTAGELLQTDKPLKLVESLCGRVMEHLGCQVFFNFLVDKQAGKLHLNACAGVPENEAKKIEWLDFGTAVCGCAARDGCRIVAEHIPSTPDPRTELVKSFGVLAYACHPIFGEGGAVLGTLSFGTRERETFSEDDLSLMKAITDQVATAMVHLEAEEALRRSEERFKVIASHTPDHIHMQDKDLRYTLVINPQLGLSEQDMIGKTDFDFLAEADAEKLMSLKREVLLTGKPMKVESSLISKNGDKEHFDGTYVPMFNAAGACDGLIGYFRNVTARKKQEDELRRINRTLKALGRSGKAMLYVKEEKSYLDEVCRIVVEDCGYSMVWIAFANDDEEKTVTPAAFAGFEEGYLKTLNVTWADTERGRGPTGAAIRTGKVTRCRNMLTDPAFAPWREQALQRGYASSIAFPIVSPAQGRPLGALTVYSKEPDGFADNEAELLAELANDLSHGIITTRIRADLDRATETLRSERNLSNAVIQTTGGLIVGQDFEGRIQIFNHACEKATGYRFDEVRGRVLWDFLLVKEEAEQVREVFKGILDGSVSADAEMESFWVTKDGEKRFIRWINSALRDEHGFVTLVLGTGIDITERQVMEERLRTKAAELTNANQELEAFAYSVSHDLRNPLHSMVGCIEILKDYQQKLDKDFGTTVGHIEQSSKRMAEIISDLLELSRVTRQEVHRDAVDVAALARSFFNELKKEAPNRKVRFNCPSRMPVQADPGLTRILVENLMRNAWKFTSHRDEAVIEFSEHADGGGRIFSVSDNGTGFDMAYADKIFEPFVRLHKEHEFKGTGIGLAIVKRIAVKHGGSVWAKGENDKGAVFYFRLE